MTEQELALLRAARAEIVELRRVVAAQARFAGLPRGGELQFVYLVCVGGEHKIGMTTRPKNRLAALRSHYPSMDLCGLWRIQGEPALDVERLWHARFRENRTHGEWFLLSESDVARMVTDMNGCHRSVSVRDAERGSFDDLAAAADLVSW